MLEHTGSMRFSSILHQVNYNIVEVCRYKWPGSTIAFTAYMVKKAQYHLPLTTICLMVPLRLADPSQSRGAASGTRIARAVPSNKVVLAPSVYLASREVPGHLLVD